MDDIEINDKALLHFAPVITVNLDKIGDEERAMLNLMVRDVLALLKQFAERDDEMS